MSAARLDESLLRKWASPETTLTRVEFLVLCSEIYKVSSFDYDPLVVQKARRTIEFSEIGAETAAACEILSPLSRDSFLSWDLPAADPEPVIVGKATGPGFKHSVPSGLLCEIETADHLALSELMLTGLRLHLRKEPKIFFIVPFCRLLTYNLTVHRTAAVCRLLQRQVRFDASTTQDALVVLLGHIFCFVSQSSGRPSILFCLGDAIVLLHFLRLALILLPEAGVGAVLQDAFVHRASDLSVFFLACLDEISRALELDVGIHSTGMTGLVALLWLLAELSSCLPRKGNDGFLQSLAGGDGELLAGCLALVHKVSVAYQQRNPLLVDYVRSLLLVACDSLGAAATVSYTVSGLKEELYRCWKIDNCFADKAYLEALWNGYYYFPIMHLSFCSMEDYLRRNFALYKASVFSEMLVDLMQRTDCLFPVSTENDLQQMLRAGEEKMVDVGETLPDDPSFIVWLAGRRRQADGCFLVESLQISEFKRLRDSSFHEAPAGFTHAICIHGAYLPFLSFLSVASMLLTLFRAGSLRFDGLLCNSTNGDAAALRTIQGALVVADLKPSTEWSHQRYGSLQELLSVFQSRTAPFALTLTHNWNNVLEVTQPSATRFMMRPAVAGVPTTASPRLYQAQQQAVFSGVCTPLTLVRGPPGTGKTQTICALVDDLSACMLPGRKIVICAHSNRAVDQIVEKLHVAQVDCLRFGFRSSSAVAASHTALGYRDRMCHLAYDLVQGVRRIAGCDAVLSSDCMQMLLQYDPSPASARRLAGHLLRDTSFRQAALSAAAESPLRSLHEVLLFLAELPLSGRALEQSLLSRIAVYAMTCSYLARMVARSEFRDTQVALVIVEEAAKLLETETLPIFALNAERIVLVGDEQQLSPLLLNPRLRFESHYNRSMFQRLLESRARSILLNEQGRATPRIADLYRWRYVSTREDGLLAARTRSAPDIVGLMDLPSTSSLALPSGFIHHVSFLNIVGSREGESGECNRTEGAAVRGLIEIMRDHMHIDTGRCVSILTPYRQQKRLLTTLLNSAGAAARDVSTVDEFQGNENDIIVVSLVAGGRKPSPFLCDQQRLTVLTSRARRALVLVGNLHTFLRSEQWKAVLMRVHDDRAALGRLELDMGVSGRCSVESLQDLLAVHQALNEGLPVARDSASAAAADSVRPLRSDGTQGRASVEEMIAILQNLRH